MKTTLQYAKIQLLRILRDPVTLIVLLGIPMLLLLIFGTFIGGDNTNVSLRVAVVNESEEAFAGEFADGLKSIDVFKVNNEVSSLGDAKDKMREGQLDGIIVLGDEFGLVEDERPTGTAEVIVNQASLSTGDIMMGIMRSVADETNNTITGSTPPIAIERSAIQGASVRVIDTLYAMFTAMAIMMVGIFGVASTIPADKKSGVLRRMRVTPFRASQLIGGMVLAFMALSLLAVTAMTLLAIFGFKLQMHGSWLDFGLFVLIASMLMIALGVMVGGWAKNTTQADIYGQIIFLGSLAFSGLWVPRALMPEWLQDITAFLPLTPLIEGLGRIVTEGVSITNLGFQLAVIAGWFVIAFVVGIKTFRWE